MKRILFLLTAALLLAALPVFAQSAASGGIVVTADAKNANPTLVFTGGLSDQALNFQIRRGTLRFVSVHDIAEQIISLPLKLCISRCSNHSQQTHSQQQCYCFFELPESYSHQASPLSQPLILP